MSTSHAKFAERHGWTMTAASVPFRPNRDGSEWDRSALHFGVEIKDRNGTPIWTGFYSVGSAHPVFWIQDMAKKAAPGIASPEARAARAALAQAGVSGPLALRDAAKLAAVPYRESVDDSELRAKVREAFKRAAPLPLGDVLESLALDWRGASESDFEDWASDFGLDPDSRKAESMWRECRDGARAARATMGAAVFAEFLDISEDDSEETEAGE